MEHKIKSNSLIVFLIEKFFSRKTFNKICHGFYNHVNDLLSDNVKKSQPEVLHFSSNATEISSLYKKSFQLYRNEYFYKNTLINKLLKGGLNFNSTSIIAELPIEKSKADMISINLVKGAELFEIKSDLDNFARLKKQLVDYYAAFKKVTVLTSEKKIKELEEILGGMTYVGISYISKSGAVKSLRLSEEYADKLSYKTMFNILRKREIESILLECTGKLPRSDIQNYRNDCYQYFRLIPIDIVYSKFVSSLFFRNTVDFDKYKNIPKEMKYLYYFSNISKYDYERLIDFLKR